MESYTILGVIKYSNETIVDGAVMFRKVIEAESIEKSIQIYKSAVMTEFSFNAPIPYDIDDIEILEIIKKIKEK